MKAVREFQLDNTWRVTFTARGDLAGVRLETAYALAVQIERLDGDQWLCELTGQVKRDGCCDWGEGDQVLLHFCGRQDAALLGVVFRLAMRLMGEE